MILLKIALQLHVFGDEDTGQECPVLHGGEVEVGGVVAQGVPDGGEAGGDKVEHLDAAGHEGDVVVLHVVRVERGVVTLVLLVQPDPAVPVALEEAQVPQPLLRLGHPHVAPVGALHPAGDGEVLGAAQQIQQDEELDGVEVRLVRAHGRVETIVPFLRQRAGAVDRIRRGPGAEGLLAIQEEDLDPSVPLEIEVI